MGAAANMCAEIPTTTAHTATPSTSSVATTPRLAGTAIEGARDMVPMLLSVLPFALTIGAVLAASSIGQVEGLLSGPLILAGAAQLMAVQMLDDGVTPFVIVFSALLINARIVLYSAAMAPWFREESLGRRLLLAIPLIDPLYFVAGARFDRCDLDRRHRQAYYAGAAALLVTGWVVAQSVAIFAGARIPEGVGLHIGAPLALAGMLAKSTPTRPALVAAAAASVLVVIGAGLPFNSAVLIAAVGGIGAGALVSRRAS
ncbi:MAG: AzlC family ABC transporter permease [Acidimicrobiia bacterium]|nr:AzlC family ABC transporter permease [Acidimicrobiia bacterium]